MTIGTILTAVPRERTGQVQPVGQRPAHEGFHTVGPALCGGHQRLVTHHAVIRPLAREGHAVGQRQRHTMVGFIEAFHRQGPAVVGLPLPACRGLGHVHVAQILVDLPSAFLCIPKPYKAATDDTIRPRRPPTNGAKTHNGTKRVARAAPTVGPCVPNNCCRRPAIPRPRSTAPPVPCRPPTRMRRRPPAPDACDRPTIRPRQAGAARCRHNPCSSPRHFPSASSPAAAWYCSPRAASFSVPWSAVGRQVVVRRIIIVAVFQVFVIQEIVAQHVSLHVPSRIMAVGRPHGEGLLLNLGQIAQDVIRAFVFPLPSRYSVPCGPRLPIPSPSVRRRASAASSP